MASPKTQIHVEEAGIFTGKTSISVQKVMDLLLSDDRNSMILAAKEIRRLTRTSSKHRRVLSGAVDHLVLMLGYEDIECIESSLMALLNLAVKDEWNKIKIVNAGALGLLINILQSQHTNLSEYATASLLTLSASPTNKPIIGSSGAIPLLVNILENGTPQAKVDALMALYNLSTHPNNLDIILSVHPIHPIINLLKACKKSSKTAGKCCALLESLVGYEEGGTAILAEEGGVLALVEVVENGYPSSREHAVGALLTMCESDRGKYKEAILREGAIPGLLELTVQGSAKSQCQAHKLLRLLRNSPQTRAEFHADTLDHVVCNIVSQIDGDEAIGNAKKMLEEMVQVSMERSLRHLQQRALA